MMRHKAAFLLAVARADTWCKENDPVGLEPHERVRRPVHALAPGDVSGGLQPADFLFLIVDGSSIYTSQSTRQWLAQRPQIVLVPLPSYAPHLNLQEQIWTLDAHRHHAQPRL